MNLGRESETTEFKESLSQLDKGLKSLCAMLNRSGQGTVYFGVDDDGEVNAKITVGKDTLADILQAARDKIEPQILLKIKECHSPEGRTYIRVSANGTDIPYSYDGRYYIRTADADESVPNHLLRKMLLKGDLDILCHIRSPKQDLTFEQLLSILSLNSYHVKDTESSYRSLSLYNEDSEYDLLAYLLSDHNDLSIKVVRFDGINKSVMSMRTEYGHQCLLRSVSAVLEYFESLNTTSVDLSSGIRKEVPLFDYEAFREAFVNACLHNSYQEQLSPAVYLYDDRIEIISYGGLSYRLSKEDFFKGVSMPVNRSLLNIFTMAGLSEQTGHGVPRIVESCGREAFTFGEDTLMVTIPFNYVPDHVLTRKLGSSGKRISGNRQKVLRYLQTHEYATLQDTAEKLGISLSGVKKICAGLQEEGFLKRRGSKKNGTWVVLFRDEI